MYSCSTALLNSLSLRSLCFFCSCCGGRAEHTERFVSVQTAFSFFCVVLFVYCASCIPTQIIVVLVCYSPRFASCEPRPESVVTQRVFDHILPHSHLPLPLRQRHAAHFEAPIAACPPFTPARTLFAFPSSATPKIHITSSSPTHPCALHVAPTR